MIDLAITNHSVPTFQLVVVDTIPADAATAADNNFASEIVANELQGAGYVRPTIANLAAVEDDAADQGILDADDPGSIGAVVTGETARGAWLIRVVTDDSDSPVWGFLGSDDLPTNGAQINLTLTAEGLFKLLQSAA
ncbi:MAG: hypothetical protein AAGA99_26350 [Actinomycetota bacterium]